MAVLTHDQRMSNHKRHLRFGQMCEKVTQTDTKLKGMFSGTALVWARARFEHSEVQVNKFNKLTFEVFSKMSGPLKLKSLDLKMNLRGMDVHIDFDNCHSLSKSNPIRMEKDFYVSEEENHIGFVMLNEI